MNCVLSNTEKHKRFRARKCEWEDTVERKCASMHCWPNRIWGKNERFENRFETRFGWGTPPKRHLHNIDGENWLIMRWLRPHPTHDMQLIAFTLAMASVRSLSLRRSLVRFHSRKKCLIERRDSSPPRLELAFFVFIQNSVAERPTLERSTCSPILRMTTRP